MRKILILSAGSLVGYNIIEALGNKRPQLRLIGTNCLADEPILYQLDQVYLVPPTKAPGFKTQILEIIAQESPDWILAGRDDDVVFLAQLAEEQPEISAKIWGQGLEMAKMMDDKWLSFEFCQAHDLPYVPSTIASDVEVLEAFATRYGYPLIAKPRSGFASRGVFLSYNFDMLCRVAQLENYVIQAYIGDQEVFARQLKRQNQFGLPIFFSLEEPKISLQTQICLDGSWGEIFCARHIMKYGMSFAVQRLEEPAFLALGQKVAQAVSQAGWRGPLNIQCKLNAAGQLQIMEFSGRLTGATAARAQLGYHELAPLLPEIYPQTPENQTAKVIKKLTCFAFQSEAQESLETLGKWPK